MHFGFVDKSLSFYLVKRDKKKYNLGKDTQSRLSFQLHSNSNTDWYIHIDNKSFNEMFMFMFTFDAPL